MATYWMEFEDGEKSLPYPSWQILKRNLSFTSQTRKFLCVKGADFDFLELMHISQYPLKIYDYDKDINWVNTKDSVYSKTIYFINNHSNEIRLEDLSLNDIQFHSSSIKNLIIKSHIDNLYIDESSAIDYLEHGKNQIGTISIIKSKIKLVSFKELAISKLEIERSSIQNINCTEGSCVSLKMNNCDHIYGSFVSVTFAHIVAKNCININIGLITRNINHDAITVESCSGKFLVEGLISHLNKFYFDLKQNYNCEIIISKSQFTGEVTFRGENYSNKKNIILQNCVFKDLVIFNENNSLGLEIDKVLFQKGIYIPINTKNLKLNEVNKTHSSVWCTLKNQALAKNDKISALTFGRYEMESYMSELKWKEGKWQEKIVLWLNNTSNRHGLSWGRGVYFTLKCWLIFFVLFYMACDNFNGLNWFNCELVFFKKDFWDKAFQFLWLPQGVTMLRDGFTNNVTGVSLFLIVISFFFGKIFIGYGIFQTISAFRKHGMSK